jgi:septum formation protein
MAEQPPFRLILASGSPARRDLLSRAGYQFEILPANIAEPTEAAYPDARTLVEHIAWLKAAAVARVAQAASLYNGPTVILAADTVGWLGGQVIGKPADAADARRILQRFMGTEHELWTGVCLWLRPHDLQIAWQEVSRVAMTPLSDADLDAYIASGAWEGCSGAYAIQEEGDDPLVRVVTGSKTNVIGLPMETLKGVLALVAEGDWLGTP